MTCAYPVGFGFFREAYRDLEVELEPQRNYYVVAPMIDGRCKPGIASKPDGEPIGTVLDERDSLRVM